MKILLIADVHNHAGLSQKRHDGTLKCLKKMIDAAPCDLIVFLGDTVHGPDMKGKEAEYEHYLREVLDLTGTTPFVTVFGNHDDECAVTKDAILAIEKTYSNCLTTARNQVLEWQGETLLLLDSGSYYEGEGSFYDTVKQETIDFALAGIQGKKAILLQHIIVPDIRALTVTKRRGLKKKCCFREEVAYTGALREDPCPPDINTGEWEKLAPFLKAAAFGHDHMNDFELTLDGVRFIQCAGAGYNSYEYPQTPSVKLLDTVTLTTQKIEGR